MCYNFHVFPPESIATLPPFCPIEGNKWFDPIFSQWESQKNRFAVISFGKIQFLPPCIWNLPFMSVRLWRRHQRGGVEPATFRQNLELISSSRMPVHGRNNSLVQSRGLSWLTNSALVYEPKCGGKEGLRGLSQWVQLYTWSPKYKLWRSKSIFNQGFNQGGKGVRVRSQCKTKFKNVHREMVKKLKIKWYNRTILTDGSEETSRKNMLSRKIMK